MTTITTTYQKNASAVKTESSYDRLIEKLTFSHFALISMAILIGSCLGGITAMYVFKSGAPFWQFVIGMGVSMANLIACIGQAPTKWVFNIFVGSLLVNLILLLSNL